ncbi:MAG TPA: CvpA family protein [Dehalococcoidales bacterium]|nr:CvpA family protein [Dehalococcoidales bacterium]
MNWLDIVIIIVIAIPAILGIRIGIIKASFSLAGLILGVILAGHYYVPLSEQLSALSPGIAKIVAFAIILVGVWVIAILLSGLVERAVSMMLLGWINRLVGAVFGFAVGTILCSALLAIWVKFLGIQSFIVDSALATILLDRFPMVLALLPDEFSAVRSFFQ